MSEAGERTLLLESERRIGGLAEQVGRVERETKAIAHKVWRGNGGKSIVEVQVRQGLLLERALERLEGVEQQLDELPKAEPPRTVKPAESKWFGGLKRLGVLIGWALLAVAAAVLVFALGPERLVLELLN